MSVNSRFRLFVLMILILFCLAFAPSVFVVKADPIPPVVCPPYGSCH